MRIRINDIDGDVLTKMTSEEIKELVNILLERIDSAESIIDSYEAVVSDYKYVLKYSMFMTRLNDDIKAVAERTKAFEQHNNEDGAFVDKLYDKYFGED